MSFRGLFAGQPESRGLFEAVGYSSLGLAASDWEAIWLPKHIDTISVLRETPEWSVNLPWKNATCSKISWLNRRIFRRELAKAELLEQYDIARELTLHDREIIELKHVDGLHFNSQPTPSVAAGDSEKRY